MKQLLTLCIAISILFSSNAIAQKKKKGVPLYTAPEMPVDASTKLITYTKIYEVTGNKIAMHRKGAHWYSNHFRNAAKVIKKNDAAEGVIIGKPRLKLWNPPDKKGSKVMGGILKYSIESYYKDEKVKLVITKLNKESQSYYPIEKWMDTSSPTYSYRHAYYLIQVDEEMKKLIREFETGVIGPTPKEIETF